MSSHSNQNGLQLTVIGTRQKKQHRNNSTLSKQSVEKHHQ